MRDVEGGAYTPEIDVRDAEASGDLALR